MKNTGLAYVIVMLLFMVFFTSQTVYSVPIQWEISDGGNGHWYEVISSPDINWINANQEANDKAGEWYLATITSQEENDFVLSLFKDQDVFWSYTGHSSLVGNVYAGPWIGGYSSSNSSNDWSWVTDEPFTFSAWGPYEPFSNGDRIYYSQFGSSKTIGWNDVPNHYTAPGYIIELPEPSSILLFGLSLASIAKLRRI